ncbi:MAG TPA: hypothetical protein PL033_01845 [Candidatus Brocadiia bacterium]|nr:hypothetical protein [Candidatus Brocadiia bacterium]
MEKKTLVWLAIFVVILGTLIELFILILARAGLDVEATRFEVIDMPNMGLIALVGKKLPVPQSAQMGGDKLLHVTTIPQQNLAAAFKDGFGAAEETVDPEVKKLLRHWTEKAAEDWLNIRLDFDFQDIDPATPVPDRAFVGPLQMVRNMQSAGNSAPFVPLRIIVIRYTIVGKGRVIPLRMKLGVGEKWVRFGVPDSFSQEDGSIFLPQELIMDEQGVVKKIGEATTMIRDPQQ